MDKDHERRRVRLANTCYVLEINSAGAELQTSSRCKMEKRAHFPKGDSLYFTDMMSTFLTEQEGVLTH